VNKNFKNSGVRTLTFVAAGLVVISIATGCGNQGPATDKPVPVVPSAGAAPGDYTAQLKASATAIQSAQRR